MIVSKFGGTSVGDAAAIRRLAAIVASRRALAPVIVVSAFARVTDALTGLESLTNSALDGAIDWLIDRHLTVARDLRLPPGSLESVVDDLESLRGSPVGAWTAEYRDRITGLGERWSSILVVEALRRAGLPAVLAPAADLIVTDDRFGQARPLPGEIARRVRERLDPLVADGAIPVTQGFVGATVDGRATTLGRGGSDYTASLLGRALRAERVEIWTDVDGILGADPKVVDAPAHRRQASYRGAAELAKFGAKVIHPATVEPLMAAGIPCWVRNSFVPDRVGTVIRAAPTDEVGTILGIASRRGGLDPVRSGDPRSASEAVVAVVANHPEDQAEFARRASVVIRALGIDARLHHASDLTVAIEIPATEADSVVRALHREFFEPAPSFHADRRLEGTAPNGFRRTAAVT